MNSPHSADKNHVADGLLAGWTKAHTVPARPITQMARTPPSGSFLMQLSLAFLLCLIDLKAEQKECNDRVVTIGARHRTPRLVVSVSDKIT